MPQYDWDKIRRDYVTDGTASYRKLAAKYGVSKDTIFARARADGWVEQRRQYSDKTTAKYEASMMAKSTRTVDAIVKARERLAEKAMAMAAKDLNPRDMHSLANTLQILAKMVGLQSDQDEREQQARIASIEARAQVQEEDESAGVIMIPRKDDDEEAEDE